ncbi:hypothetical protein AB9K26_02490 [Psychroserpens sp. XS_ASV72]|uniref:hypothetical protein n=1 Tax=Psychroserpens sp. XS_ASV72 TaxID=3241293 RepID=UPI0035198BB8
MKLKHILLIFMLSAFSTNAEAQLLKKLKKKINQVTKIDKSDTTQGSNNSALEKNTEEKKAFYTSDVVIQLVENGKTNQTQYFDSDAVAVKLEDTKQPKPGFVDSEGFMYVYKDGEYTKSSLIAVQSQGLMAPTMMIEAYKLPPEPFMAKYQKQTDIGMTANPFNGIVEFAFIYKPDDFRYDDFNEIPQKIKGKTYTKFEFLNEPGYEGSYVLFDDQDRLVEIFTKMSENAEMMTGFGSNGPKGESSLKYDYKSVEVNLPYAREVKAAGQGLMEGVMENIVKGGKQPKEDIDEEDYDTSEEKGMTKRMRSTLRNHKVTSKDLKDRYEFDWELETEMQLNNKRKEVIQMVFLINKSANYQATKMIMEDTKNEGVSTMLFDMDLKSMVMFMEAQGQKFLQIHPIPDPVETKELMNTYKITDLPSKTIIGYNCKGLQLEDDKYIMKVYHTSEAEIKLSNFLNFGNQNQKMGMPNIDSKVVEQFSNGLLLEMDIIDKKKSKNNVNIIAKSLKNNKTSIEKVEYQTMDFFSGGQMLKKTKN